MLRNQWGWFGATPIDYDQFYWSSLLNNNIMCFLIRNRVFMPRKNVIFSYLTPHDRHASQLDAAGQRYIMISVCPIASANMRGIETHITIYEFYDPQHDCLTALHYSAYYTDVSGGAAYRLHLYYDNSGNLQRGPLLYSISA